MQNDALFDGKWSYLFITAEIPCDCVTVSKIASDCGVHLAQQVGPSDNWGHELLD